MRKVGTLLCVSAILLTLLTPPAHAKVSREPGGIPAFFVGCCWGIREGSEWNEGADMHWREWLRIVPVAGLVVSVWDGIECMDGVTAKDWAKQYGANWY